MQNSLSIAFFSPGKLSKSLGATKNRLELGESIRSYGFEVHIFSEDDLRKNINCEISYSELLKLFLIDNSEKFDVVIYEADTLPYDRNLFCKKTLMVARPALVRAHFLLCTFPTAKNGFLRIIARRLKDRFTGRRRISEQERYNLQLKTCRNADLIQVQNPWDADALKAAGLRNSVFEIIPNGISRSRLSEFSTARSDHKSKSHNIVFVGSFDYRKGCLDLVKIFTILEATYEDATLTILGAGGLFQKHKQVIDHFPEKLRSKVYVMMKYDNMELPSLLKNFDIGIFPSYIESFGFAVIEMMASKIPVVSYASPGPESFVPRNMLVDRGNIEGMVEKIKGLFDDAETYRSACEQCEQVLLSFIWEDIALNAISIYQKYHNKINIQMG